MTAAKTIEDLINDGEVSTINGDGTVTDRPDMVSDKKDSKSFDPRQPLLDAIAEQQKILEKLQQKLPVVDLEWSIVQFLNSNLGEFDFDSLNSDLTFKMVYSVENAQFSLDYSVKPGSVGSGTKQVFDWSTVKANNGFTLVMRGEKSINWPETIDANPKLSESDLDLKLSEDRLARLKEIGAVS